MDASTQQFFDELNKNPEVLGVILFGSYARGDNRPDSDIDLLVLVSEGNTERKIESIAGKTYEMIWVTESEALNYWEGDKDGCYGLWQDAQIVLDKSGAVEKLHLGAERIIAKGKAAISNPEMTHRRFDIEDQMRALKWLARDDITAANHTLHQIMADLVMLFFDIEVLWAPPPKRALQLIRKTNPRLGMLLDMFYSPQSTFEKSVSLAEEIIQEIFKD